MAFCRWSTDNFRCDLYCYEGDGGFTTHVAGRRWKIVPWLNPYYIDTTIDYTQYENLWHQLHKEYHRFLEETALEIIDLPHAGESFGDPTLEAMLARMEDLRELGYIVPQFVVDNIRQIIEEEERN